jgi:hypothetical protein
MMDVTQYSPSSQAVQIMAPTTAGASVIVNNISAASVFIGDAGVTKDTGFEVPASEAYAFDVRPGSSLYAVTAANPETIQVVVAKAMSPRLEVPKRVTLGGASGAGIGSPAAMAATVAGLGAGVEGKMARIKVGSSDLEYVDLIFDAEANAGLGQWTSDPFPIIHQSDIAYMGSNSTGWAYIGGNASGGTSGAIGWSTRAIRHALDLYTAGLRLQLRLGGIIAGTSAPASYTVMPFWFQHNDGEVVVFSADGSAAFGWLGAPLVSPVSSQITFRDGTWQELLKNTLNSVVTVNDILKQNIWPRLYGKLSAGGGAYGTVIDVNLEARWVG